MANKKANKKSSRKTKVKTEEPTLIESNVAVVETLPDVESVISDIEVDVEQPPKQRKKRAVPTAEIVACEFDAILQGIDDEITKIREAQTKAKGVKFLRSLGKKLKLLRTHSLRIAKKKRVTTRKNSQNSGFRMPVKISKELAKFAGWDVNEKKSRVEVTKFICSYIKEHDLQFPEDRRQILVDKDPKLKKLLKYHTGSDNQKPLMYHTLQTYLKPHYIKE